jgi:hypothetical protein
VAAAYHSAVRLVLSTASSGQPVAVCEAVLLYRAAVFPDAERQAPATPT